MKKKLLILLTLTLAFTSNQVLAQATTVKITLNGISLDSAKSWVARFRAQNIKKPLSTSVWFSKDIIHKMITLITSENIVGTQKIIPDGIRVYFATNSNNQNTVLLVSTYDNGEDTSVPSGRIHQDYFDHASNDPLILMASTSNGEICNDSYCNGGALLYQYCGKNCGDDSNCDATNIHYLTRKYAEQMVWNFGSGLINTSSEWFDLKMIAEFDKEADYNGIRIYFARNLPNDPIKPSTDSFVWVTTQLGPNSINLDYFTCDKASAYFTSANHISTNHVKRGLNTLITATILSNGQDNGEQCPNNCKGTSLP
jgi:hypothetical protein